MRNARVACAIVRQPSEAFWTAVRAVAWIDMEKVYVVGAGDGAGAPPNTSYIVPTPDLPVDRYRIRDHALLVAPGSVESVAAGWIAQQLKDRNGLR